MVTYSYILINTHLSSVLYVIRLSRPYSSPDRLLFLHFFESKSEAFLMFMSLPLPTFPIILKQPPVSIITGCFQQIHFILSPKSKVDFQCHWGGGHLIPMFENDWVTQHRFGNCMGPNWRQFIFWNSGDPSFLHIHLRIQWGNYIIW